MQECGNLRLHLDDWSRGRIQEKYCGDPTAGGIVRPPPNEGNTLRYLIDILRFGAPYLRRYWMPLVAGICFSMFFGLTNGALVWGTKTILERLTPPSAGHAAAPNSFRARAENVTNAMVDRWLPRVGRNIDSQQIVGGLLFLPLLVGTRGAARYLGAWSMAWVSENVVSDLRCDVLRKLQSLSLDFFNRSTMGDLLMRVNGDTAALNRCLSAGFTDAIKEPFTMIGIFVALCAIDWKLTLGAMTVTPLCLVPIAILGRRARRASATGARASISQSSLLVEMLGGIRVIKALSLEKQQTDRFRAFSHELIRASVKSSRAREQINPIIETISMLGLGLLIIYVFLTHRTTPEMVAFLSGMLLFFLPIKRLAALHVLLQESKFGVDRLGQILAEQPTVKEKPDSRPVTGFSSAIRLRDVSFAYDARRVLDGVDLEIRRGMKLGIAGENGSGKSTLVNLLLRFYDPSEGVIEIDGVNLRDVRLFDLRNLIGLVTQEVVIFDQSIGENIAAARLGATREQVEEAARAAGCHEFIINLPDGYDTTVGERGVRLSGGERQRISIARAFIRDAAIVILDEATASLDARAEGDIQEAINRLEEHRTVICVAHRLSTLATMDTIVVLSAGRIIEQGTYRELLGSDGPFARMARQQGLTLSSSTNSVPATAQVSA